MVRSIQFPVNLEKSFEARALILFVLQFLVKHKIVRVQQHPYLIDLEKQEVVGAANMLEVCLYFVKGYSLLG